ncbi:hypothetical protein OUZ56_017441 [Daphnia magna]|uniref:Uncharacterized protein n=1 Tax=Daphnia magna TaxID=35525 RepID=A0ABR0AST7_9CRUS|nr:hypothetical protein OUZ56_017441 [Daphnia magna]
MVVQHVLFEGQRIPAVIDTRAVVSVCSPAGKAFGVKGKTLASESRFTDRDISGGKTGGKGEADVGTGTVDSSPDDGCRRNQALGHGSEEEGGGLGV